MIKSKEKSAAVAQNRYLALIEKIFFDRYKPGVRTVDFKREDLKSAAIDLEISLPENLGDVIYALRFRVPMPASILKTQPKGYEWLIELAGRSLL